MRVRAVLKASRSRSRTKAHEIDARGDGSGGVEHVGGVLRCGEEEHEILGEAIGVTLDGLVQPPSGS